MGSSYRLIAEANEFLDAVEYANAVESSGQNIERLIDYREEMENSGFDAPYLPAISLRALAKELEKENIEDIKKQISSLRYAAYLKKMTLRRVKVSIAAHKMLDCELDTDIKTLLPLDGSYITHLVRLPYFALHIYYKIKEWLKGKQEEHMLVTVETGKSKEKITFKLLSMRGDITDRVKREYGDDATVVSTKIIRPKGLVGDAAVRTALATAITRLAYGEALKQLPERSPLLIEYNSVLKRNGFVEDVVISGEKHFENVINEMLEKGFVKEMETEDAGANQLANPLANPSEEEMEEFTIDKRIINELAGREKHLKSTASGIALRRIATQVLRFYALNSTAQREKTAVIPALTNNPTHEQIAMLSSYGNSIGISGLQDAVIDKIKNEDKCKIDHQIFGACYLVIKCQCDSEKIGKLLGIEAEAIDKNIPVVKSLLEGRGSEFIELLRENKKE